MSKSEDSGPNVEMTTPKEFGGKVDNISFAPQYIMYDRPRMHTQTSTCTHASSRAYSTSHNGIAICYHISRIIAINRLTRHQAPSSAITVIPFRTDASAAARLVQHCTLNAQAMRTRKLRPSARRRRQLLSVVHGHSLTTTIIT